MFTPDAIDPQQRMRQSHLQSARRTDGAGIPLYGLPSGWVGQRCTGNTEFQTGVTRDADGVHHEMHETIELCHERGASLLTIESTDHPLPIDDGAMRAVNEAASRTDPLTIRLDGLDVAFAAARAEDVVVARWVGYEATVTVTAVRWPMATGLELVRITDLAPYHEGRLRMLEQRSGYDLRG